MTLFQIPRRRAVLGVALGSREIAVAVVSCHKSDHELATHRVARLRRLKTEEDRGSAFSRIIEKTLERYPVTLVVSVEREPAAPTVVNQRALLAQICDRLGVAQRGMTNTAVRENLVHPPTRATNRALGVALQRRLRRLSAILPEHLARDAPGEPTRFPSTQERYWFRLYMAIGAALCGLEDSEGSLTPAA